ncbi:ABC transporter permease subunit [Sutcliffiella horikoshii]|uniref:ABC transporter permease subunit n=1 Tax=Sutcliffiella horikoshii TaxID=79883 RepID=A0A5D4T1K1_9BACI|nr:ABC transporter permease [Sutcliffiella horikoshii]TYS69570.1 ABC transporter permease subunit [Sutcliffiella horikoshii]
MRIAAVVIRILRQFLRDKRTLGLMIFAPMLILALMNVVFTDQEPTMDVGLVGEVQSLQANLEDENMEFILIDSEEDGWERIGESEIDAFLTKEKIVLEGSDPSTNKAILLKLQKMNQPDENKELPFEIEYAYGSESMEMFDNIGPFLIVFFVFFFVFLIAGVSFLRERTSGTLERLMATPIKRSELVIGYVVGFGIFTLIQSSIIVLFTIYILDIQMAGNILSILFVTFTVAITALTLGTLLSAFARNELQMIQFIPLVVVPQVFFSGLFSIEAMPSWLQKVSLVMPLTYAGDAMKDIMIRGKGIEEIYSNILLLFGFSLLFILLNIKALKKYRPT